MSDWTGNGRYMNKALLTFYPFLAARRPNLTSSDILSINLIPKWPATGKKTRTSYLFFKSTKFSAWQINDILDTHLIMISAKIKFSLICHCTGQISHNQHNPGDVAVHERLYRQYDPGVSLDSGVFSHHSGNGISTCRYGKISAIFLVKLTIFLL